MDISTWQDTTVQDNPRGDPHAFFGPRPAPTGKSPVALPSLAFPRAVVLLISIYLQLFLSEDLIRFEFFNNVLSHAHLT